MLYLVPYGILCPGETSAKAILMSTYDHGFHLSQEIPSDMMTKEGQCNIY